MKRILLVEAKQSALLDFKNTLINEGYKVISLTFAEDVINEVCQREQDLIILDACFKSRFLGLNLCADIKKVTPIVPIVCLSCDTDEFTLVAAILSGADDCINMKISTNVFLVKINSLIQRTSQLLNYDKDSYQSSLYILDDLTIDTRISEVYWKSKRIITNSTQYKLVYELAKHPGIVRSHAHLMTAANITVEPNTIVAYMKSIRKLFRKIDLGFCHIKTEYSKGYIWKN